MAEDDDVSLLVDSVRNNKPQSARSDPALDREHHQRDQIYAIA
jgi:hypothetical protein